MASVSAQGAGCVAGAFEDVVEEESAARLEDSRDFAVEGLLVGDVHLDVFGDDDVEGPVGEGEFEGGGVLKVDAVGEVDEVGEFVADRDVLFGEVDAGDAALVLVGEVSCGASEAAADVEDAVGGREFGEGCEFEGGFAAAGVELVDGGEVVDGDFGEVFAGGDESGFDSGEDVA